MSSGGRENNICLVVGEKTRLVVGKKTTCLVVGEKKHKTCDGRENNSGRENNICLVVGERRREMVFG